MAEELRFSSPEEELKYLEQRVLEKRQEIQEHGEKPVVREILREHVAGIPSVQITSDVAHSSVSDDTSAGTPQTMSDEHVQAYVNLAFESGIQTAVEHIRQTHNPHLIDAFHDALVDRFVEQLRSRGMLGS